jgi:hypothetical protein
MSQINPLTGSILQTGQVQRQQSADKDRQVRRAVEQTKNAELADDQLEHQVESSEELQPIQKEPKQDRQFKRSKHPHAQPAPDESDEDEKPRLDLTA